MLPSPGSSGLGLELLPMPNCRAVPNLATEIVDKSAEAWVNLARASLRRVSSIWVLSLTIHAALEVSSSPKASDITSVVLKRVVPSATTSVASETTSTPSSVYHYVKP